MVYLNLYSTYKFWSPNQIVHNSVSVPTCSFSCGPLHSRLESEATHGDTITFFTVQLVQKVSSPLFHVFIIVSRRHVRPLGCYLFLVSMYTVCSDVLICECPPHVNQDAIKVVFKTCIKYSSAHAC